MDGVSYSDLRQLELVLTPDGFLKAALAASDATAISLSIVGPRDIGLFPPQPGTQPPAPNAALQTLYQNMLKLKLDVAQHVPIHGRVGTNDEFLKIVGKTQ
jgi:hypothetical protein